MRPGPALRTRQDGKEGCPYHEDEQYGLVKAAAPILTDVPWKELRHLEAARRHRRVVRRHAEDHKDGYGENDECIGEHEGREVRSEPGGMEGWGMGV